MKKKISGLTLLLLLNLILMPLLSVAYAEGEVNDVTFDVYGDVYSDFDDVYDDVYEDVYEDVYYEDVFDAVYADPYEVAKVPVKGTFVQQLEEKSWAPLFMDSSDLQKLISKAATIEISKGNDVTIKVPALNLKGDKEAKFEIVKLSSTAVQKLPDYKNIIGSVFDFTITQGDATVSTFSQPVTIYFKVDPKSVKDPKNLKVFYYNEKTKQWDDYGVKTLGYENGILTATTTHFSTFAVKVVSPTSTTTVINSQASSTSNHELPDTATNNYNWVLAGGLLVAAGSTLTFVKRKENN